MAKKLFRAALVSMTCYLTALAFFVGTATFAEETDSSRAISLKEEVMQELGYDPTLSCLPLDSAEEYGSGERVSICSNSESTTTTVYTPNGTAVMVYEYISDLEDSYISYLNGLYDSVYSQATRLGTATRFYNCHSYAWYNSSVDNHYWMDDPSAYYIDRSYCETDTPAVGDIVCYYTSSGELLHSAIITAISSADSDLGGITVKSKWGKCGLYSHVADYCPYMPIYGGSTSYVKYYRRHSVCTYTYNYVEIDSLKHKEYCRCGEYIISPHVVSAEATGRYTNCLYCNALVDLYDDSYISFLSIENAVYFTENGSYILSNGIYVLVDADIEAFEDGTLVFYSKDSI